MVTKVLGWKERERRMYKSLAHGFWEQWKHSVVQSLSHF